MGRPVEVTDGAIIQVGQKLSAEGIAVNGTRLWKELGKRGRPDRMALVWANHLAATAPNLD